MMGHYRHDYNAVLREVMFEYRYTADDTEKEKLGVIIDALRLADKAMVMPSRTMMRAACDFRDKLEDKNQLMGADDYWIVMRDQMILDLKAAGG